MPGGAVGRPRARNFAHGVRPSDLSRMSERRFNEAEVAEIFDRATAANAPGQRQLPASEGMTLAQLQDIGREVGIAPEQLAEAAKSIEVSGRATSRTFLGVPVGVGVSVDLARSLTDSEWDRFVVDLRVTFDARGRVVREGSLRQWSNGNLQVLLEPSASGQRLRFRTLKRKAPGMIGGGLAISASSIPIALLAYMRTGVTDIGMAMALGTLATLGVAIAVTGGIRLPGWARLRRQQMEQLAARAAVIASLPPNQGDAS
jgi:hypothetical protein